MRAVEPAGGTEDETTFPALSPGILLAATPTGGVVYDLVEERLSFLNPTGIAVCAACATGAERKPVEQAWAATAGIDEDRVHADVDTALTRFRADGFIDRTTEPRRRYLPDAPVTDLAPGDHTTTQAAGVHRIRFRSTDAALVAAVDALFGLGTTAEPTAEFHIEPLPDGAIRLVTDTEWRFPDREELVARLVLVVNDFVARTTTDVVLHAAAVRSPTGHVVVFPAASGSGKSTLAALLVQHGWAYLGDESVTIRHDDLATVPCAKPIELDAGSCAALGLPAELAGDVPLTAIAADAEMVRTPAPPPAAVVFPTFVGPDGSAQRGTLDFDEALVALVGGTLNLRYVGDTGLETLVALAAGVPAHTIAYRTGAEALEQLTHLGFDSPPTGG